MLDLDETLVHAQRKPIEGADFQIDVEFDNNQGMTTYHVNIRPFVSEFLTEMHKHYELVVFTASLPAYAHKIIDRIDPSNLISYTLTREDCTQTKKKVIKDLSRLGRPMTDVLLLDNSPDCYYF